MPTFPDMSGQTTSKPHSTPSSGKAGGVKYTSTKPVDCGPLVNKIVEGLHGDAIEIACDVGLGQVTAPGGLEAHACLPRECRKKPRNCVELDKVQVDLCLEHQACPAGRTGGSSLCNFERLRGRCQGTCRAVWTDTSGRGSHSHSAYSTAYPDGEDDEQYLGEQWHDEQSLE